MMVAPWSPIGPELNGALGEVEEGFAASLTPGDTFLIGGQIGPRLAERINERKLKDIFIFLLTLIGIHLIYNAF